MQLAEQGINRADGLGGSDQATLWGLNDYEDEFTLWLKKRGLVQPAEPTWRMLMGLAVQRGILEIVYPAFTGKRVRVLDVTRRHPVNPHMYFTPDAECIDEPRGIDAKWVAWDQRHKWEDGLTYQAQLQGVWYMACTQYPHWDFIIVCGGDDPRVITMDRDLELEAHVIERAEQWWHRHMVLGEQPPVGRSESAGRYIREMFPRHKRDSIREATKAEACLLDNYAQLRTEEKELTQALTQVENQLKVAIADAEGLTWPRGRMTWKNTKDVVVTDWEAIASRLMDHMPTEQRLALLEQNSRLKAGPRRVYFRSTLEDA